MASSSTTGQTGVSYPVFLGVSITLIALVGLLILVRISANIKAKQQLFYVDDYVSIAAVVLIAATFGLDYHIVKAITDPAVNLLTLENMGVAVDFFSGASMIASKMPVLLLYIRLFGVKTWLRVSSYLTIALLTALMLVSMITIGAWSAHNGVACGIVSIIIDIIALLLPIPVISRLRLPVYKRAGLCLVFASGLLAIAASCVSLRFKYNSLSGTSSDTTTAIFCTNIEWCIAVMVGCVPSLNSFWTFFISNSTLYSKITSAISALTLQTSSAQSREYSVKSRGPSIPVSSTRESTDRFMKNSVTATDHSHDYSHDLEMLNVQHGTSVEIPKANIAHVPTVRATEAF